MILVAKIFKRFFLISLLFLGACSKDKEILSISGQIFGTFYDIKIEASQKDFTKVNEEINNVFILLTNVAQHIKMILWCLLKEIIKILIQLNKK